MKEIKPRKKYFKSPERHLPTTITKTIVKTVPRVIYVLDEKEALAAILRNQGKKKMILNKHIKGVKEILKSKDHFFVKCEAVSSFQICHNLSEREAAKMLGVSKSEIHRLNTVATTPGHLYESIMRNEVGYYAVYLMMSAPQELKLDMRNAIISGSIKTFKQAKQFLETSKDPEKLARKNEFERIQKKYNNKAAV